MSGRFEDFIEKRVWPELAGTANWKIYLFRYFSRIILIWTILATFVFFWRHFGPLKTTVDAERLAAAQKCAKGIQEDLRAHRGEYRNMTCLPFEGDSADAVFTATRDEFLSSGAFDVRELVLTDRIRRFMGVSLAPVESDATAARRARRQKSDVALCGRVRRFEKMEDGVAVVVEYRLIDATTGAATHRGTYDSTAIADATEGTGFDAPIESSTSRVWTLPDAAKSNAFAVSLWILAALAIPILSFRFLEGAAARRSNAANLFALVACLVADGICAWIFVAPTFRTKSSWLGVAAMAVFALWYDLQVLHLAHRRTEPYEEGGR